MAYRAAIVGCGSIGHAHMEGYQLVDGVDVVAIVDPVPEARAHYLEQYPDLSLQEYATVDQMLADAKPDIVSVCTWHLLHPAPTIAAAQAGVKAVICEKPMAIGMGAANSMVEACDVSGTKLVISHQRRFTPGWEKGRQLVADGVIGTPQFVTNKVREGLTNWGTHTIDGSRFVLGDPRAEWVMGAVERRTDRFERDTAIEDACMGLIHFEGGVQLFIQSDMMAEGATAGGFQIRGTEGFMEISETTIRLLNDDGWQDVEIDLDDNYKGIGGSTNAAQVQELLTWLDGGSGHRGDGHTARETVEVMMALYESARRNEVVRLPMEEKGYPLDLMIGEGNLPVREEGRYDIRSFLSWEGVDQDAYRKLHDEGVGHHQAMRQLHEKRS
ncbi:MAG: Gfo/Idh/MocA family oxidoreductase [Gemmatimonadetes bacterium]|jgi:predicted dehydrogenase|nr:Gfo/Idh/MocA family oxidoreductase [Gemmatimonadota bacterium]MBT6145805.1 Gfo/Idh/MocA family oxidoreductase [Gemmatimonadota bacterium]MBT7860168.1 Gfo/Idh/MocA family oxidoreductase [Gemmatimonadota bacterium]